jgi:hypothetical protein
LADVPSSYLHWCLTDCEYVDDRPWLWQAIRDELDRRRAGHSGSRPSGPASTSSSTSPPAPPWESVIARWFQKLTMKWHPDRGGTTEAMQAVNDARDLLRAILKETSQ